MPTGLASLPPTRKLLLRLKDPGEGPTPEQRAKSWFRVRFEGEAWTRWQQGPVTRATALPLEYRELPPGFNPRTLQLATDLMRDGRDATADKAAETGDRAGGRRLDHPGPR